MLDYYVILGIPKSADEATIRSAYKKLALKYHPDRNPNNQAAEEYFKLVNEAHQILSNTLRKEQYDLMLAYAHQQAHSTMRRSHSNSPRTGSPPPYSRQKRSIYDRYGKQTWQYTPPYKTASPYKIDKNYYRVQLWTLAAVTLFSLLSMGIFKTNEYLKEQRALEIQQENDRIVLRAEKFYSQGQYRKALNLMTDLINKHPIETEFSNKKESMVTLLGEHANALYQNAEYESAVEELEIVRDYQRPIRLSTWEKIADCHYRLKNYKKAIHAFDYVLIRDKYNVALIIKIGDIYFEHLGMIDKALQYYSDAKNLFKDLQIATYGEAFELVMPVDRVPLIYFNLFSRRGEINMAADNHEEAITDYNWAIYLRPDIPEPYYLRAVCRQKTGNMNRACMDWRKAIKYGHKESARSIKQFCR